ncbi:hypothetical protein ACXZ65_34360 [Streptomyces aculeolatus]
MAATKTRTIEQLVAEYAEPIADAVGLDVDDDDRTLSGFTRLLSDAADMLSPADCTREWLEDAAEALTALGYVDTDTARQAILARVDGLLYEAKSDLESC